MNNENTSSRVAEGPLYRHSRRVALNVVAGQIVVAYAISLCLTLLVGYHHGYSALVGAGIGILPTYYLALRMFRRSRRSLSPEQALRNIYIGEGIKVMFTLALFVLAILKLTINLPVVAGGYIATVAVNWTAVYFTDLGESPRRGVGD